MSADTFLKMLTQEMIKTYNDADKDAFFQERRLPEKIECGAYQKSEWFYKMVQVLEKDMQTNEDRSTKIELLENVILPYIEKKYYEAFSEDIHISDCSFDILTDTVSFPNEPLCGHNALGLEIQIEKEESRDECPDLDPYEYDHDYDDSEDDLYDTEDYEDYDGYETNRLIYLFLYESEGCIKLYEPTKD